MVVLYNPHSSANRKPILPFALLALGAVLEGRYEYVIVDGNLESTPIERLSDLIQMSESGSILGVTVMPGPQLEEAVGLCRELRTRFQYLTIVWGGYFPTQHWETCLYSGLVDYVVRGHGERVFEHLLDALAGGNVSPAELAKIDGLAYCDPAGRPISNRLGPVPVVKDLPPFGYARLPMERYVRSTYLGTRTLGYHSSYGCPFFCNFCAVVNMVNGKWFPQTAAQVAEAVRHYVNNWKVNGVEFYDNNFFVHEERSAEFAERITGLDVGWWGEARIDTLLKYSDFTWRRLRDSGLKMIFMGAESGSLETLRRMDKGGTMSPDKTLEIARKTGHLGIIPEFSFVVGSPPDPARDITETISFVRKVKRANPQAEIILYLYTPVPLAGDLYDQAQAEGFEFPTTLDEWISPKWSQFSQRRSATLPWVPQPSSERLRDFEHVLNAYYPTATDPRLVGVTRLILRAAAAWRYHTQYYRYPLELRALQRAVAYRRPETSGF